MSSSTVFQLHVFLFRIEQLTVVEWSQKNSVSRTVETINFDATTFASPGFGTWGKKLLSRDPVHLARTNLSITELTSPTKCPGRSVRNREFYFYDDAVRWMVLHGNSSDKMQRVT